MNRAALGLAVGAGYVLGRTKKMKLAFAVGTMVAGKRLKLSPRALAGLVSSQLEKNPQFKEIGNQLRHDLRGVGTAASGALVERQIEGLAGRLHARTQGVQDRIAGVAPDTGDVRDAGERVTGVVRGRRRRDEDDGEDDGEEYDDEDAAYADEEKDKSSANGGAAARKTSRRPARTAKSTTSKSAPSKSATSKSATSRSGAARSGAAKKTAAKKTATKKTATKTAAEKSSAKGAGDGGTANSAKSSAARAPRAAKKTAGGVTRAAKGGRGRG